MLKISYESPELELIAFESADEITALSSLVSEGDTGNNDNEIGADDWD